MPWTRLDDAFYDHGAAPDSRRFLVGVLVTALPPPSPEQSAYVAGFKDGLRAMQRVDREPRPFTPYRHITTAELARLEARTIIGGRYTMHQARAFLAGVTVTALVTVAALLAVPVRAHDITSAVADCAGSTITVKGTDFELPANSPVTVTGPGTYSQTFPVSTPDWTHTLPLGPNGSYSVTWPGAGTHAFTFTVACTQPTAPPTPTPTRGAVPPEPTPAVTPSPPTPSPTPQFSPTPNPTLVPSPTASVVAATGTPHPSQTLPPTDTE